MIARGNLIFGREGGEINEEKAGYSRKALLLYQDAAGLISDDPRPVLYQGLCHGQLTGIAQSQDENQRQFTHDRGVLVRVRRAQLFQSPDFQCFQ
jgi:hypothetical protein